MARVYKIVGRAEWERAKERGVYAGSELDQSDGYIHLSTDLQAAETARRHFHGRGDLLLIALDPEAFEAPLQWEPSRGGDLFPHLYGPFPVSDALSVREIALDASGAPQLGDLAP